ncbi:MAG: hypothetical protein MK098_15060 [Marinovum sp.]|nr:hypothetical protein [Marinovum sp.]
MDHAYLVECGYSHSELNAMTEPEFAAQLEARIELDQLRKDAMEDGK